MQLALEVAARALRDVGYEQRTFDREQTSVILVRRRAPIWSVRTGSVPFILLHGELPAELDDQLPALTDDWSGRAISGSLPRVHP